MSNQQEVFLVIDSVDWCDQWEPENDVRCLLIGAFGSKDRAEQEKVKYDKKHDRDARVVKVPFNRQARAKSETGFVELDGVQWFDDSMYDDPMDI